jgi:glucosamine--fructose-6-phosphate aminotransferase (isomerizing)
MCGIFGIVARDEQQLGPILIQAGRMLSYRGYDSVGCATIDQQGHIDLRKDVGKIDEVAEKYALAEMRGNRGILQLRWATFGTPSQVNAQPHLDSDGDLVGAHNGNVVNNAQLRQEFIAEGMTVRSENDGESCVMGKVVYMPLNGMWIGDSTWSPPFGRLTMILKAIMPSSSAKQTMTNSMPSRKALD